VRTCTYFSKIKGEQQKAKSNEEEVTYFDDGCLIEDFFIECFANRLRDKLKVYLNHRNEQFDFQKPDRPSGPGWHSLKHTRS
jgi:hypothetical protein